MLHNLNSTAVNGVIFIKNLQGGTFNIKYVFVYASLVEIPSNSIKFAKIWFIDIQVIGYGDIMIWFFSILRIFPGKFW
jgi:hypothetical protein